LESTLAVDLYRLQREVGDQAGFGFGPRYGGDEWDSVMAIQIESSVETGIRSVYQTQEVFGPDGTPIIPADYDWSFMAPKKTLTLASGANEVMLPDDFGGIRGTIIPVQSGRCFYRVRIVGEEDLYSRRNTLTSQTGPPQMAYVEWIPGTTIQRGQRAKLSIFPTADQEYPLQIWYDVLANALSSALPYVYGGAAHAETFLAAVRAAYEDKYLKGGNGKEKATFLERLRASIQRDRKFKPVHIGKNLDRSDGDYYGRVEPTIAFDYEGITPG
jgi:hypothetical protein